MNNNCSVRGNCVQTVLNDVTVDVYRNLEKIRIGWSSGTIM